MASVQILVVSPPYSSAMTSQSAVDALRHAHREAVQRGRRLERLLDPGGIHARDLDRVDGAQAFAHAQRTLERPLDRHLLVEAEADQQRGGILADEPIRVRVARPLELQGRRRASLPRRVRYRAAASELRRLARDCVHSAHVVARASFRVEATGCAAEQRGRRERPRPAPDRGRRRTLDARSTPRSAPISTRRRKRSRPASPSGFRSGCAATSSTPATSRTSCATASSSVARPRKRRTDHRSPGRLTMRALVFKDFGAVELVDVPKPAHRGAR